MHLGLPLALRYYKSHLRCLWDWSLAQLPLVLGQGRLVDYQFLEKNTTRRRPRRGWFDFVGQIGHKMFGLATDSSVCDCRRLLASTQRFQQVIVYQVNEQTTVLNHTQSAVALTQQRVN